MILALSVILMYSGGPSNINLLWIILHPWLHFFARVQLGTGISPRWSKKKHARTLEHVAGSMAWCKV